MLLSLRNAEDHLSHALCMTGTGEVGTTFSTIGGFRNQELGIVVVLTSLLTVKITRLGFRKYYENSGSKLTSEVYLAPVVIASAFFYLLKKSR